MLFRNSLILSLAAVATAAPLAPRSTGLDVSLLAQGDDKVTPNYKRGEDDGITPDYKRGEDDGITPDYKRGEDDGITPDYKRAEDGGVTPDY